jgi:Fe-S oxidoreductase
LENLFRFLCFPYNQGGRHMIAVAEMIRLTGADACVECGKCSAACSMAEMYPDFSGNSSPRGIVQHVLRRAGGLEDRMDAVPLLRCLQCGNCTRGCPEGVDCMELIAVLREEARQRCENGFRFCSGCGREIAAEPVRQWLDTVFGTAKKPEPVLFFSGMFPQCPDGPESDDTAQSAYQSLCPVCRRQAYAAGNG